MTGWPGRRVGGSGDFCMCASKHNMIVVIYAYNHAMGTYYHKFTKFHTIGCESSSLCNKHKNANVFNCMNACYLSLDYNT